MGGETFVVLGNEFAQVFLFQFQQGLGISFLQV